MVLIVICHTVKYYTFIPGHSKLNQVFNVGVYVFLLISGFLYGGKEIREYGKWLLGRVKKVVLPASVVSLCDIVLLWCLGASLRKTTILAYVFNLQGLLFLNWDFFCLLFEEIPNLGPLWFTTIIMICYLSLPFLQSLCKWSQKGEQKILRSLFVIGTFFVIAAFFLIFHIIDLSYIFIFIVGYFLRFLGFTRDSTNPLSTLILTILTIILQFARIVIKLNWPSFEFYSMYVSLSHSILGFWIFYIAFAFEKREPEFIQHVASSKIIREMDSLSYYIFLVHGLFCMGEILNVYKGFDNLIVSTMTFLGLTLLVAGLLRKLTNRIVKITDAKGLLIFLKGNIGSAIR